MSKSVWFMTKICKIFDSHKNTDDFKVVKDFNENIYLIEIFFDYRQDNSGNYTHQCHRESRHRALYRT